MFDPYQILGIEKVYALDMKQLEQRYFEMQRKAHPDQFVNASSEQKVRALKLSTELNQAYAILKDPVQRALILLEMNGIKPLKHEPETLMLVMEWNEKVDRGEDVLPELNQMQQELFTDIETGFSEDDFEKVRKSLYRLTYVSKLLRDRKI